MKIETIVGLFVLSSIGIFLYLSFSIGTLRVDRDKFHSYKAYFEDTAGLEIKDPVKIAGVEVGRVTDIRLVEEGRALVIFLVNKQNQLAKNAAAMVRQEGLIGNKYLEIDPGDSATGIILPGSALSLPSQAPVSIGEVINKFSDIADSIKDVAKSFRSVFATREGKASMRDALRGLSVATEKIAGFSEILERTLQRNEENMNRMLTDFRYFAETLRRDSPSITRDLRGAASQLKTKVFPSVSSGMDEVKRVSGKVGDAMEGMEDAAVQARESFKEIGLVAEKVNTGKGLVGKIINEDETYTDFKKTMKGLRDYTSKLHSLDVLVDMHSETMIRDWKDKSYFELKLRPTEDYFYTLQLVSSERGSFSREVYHNKRFDEKGNKLTAPTATDLYRYPDREEVIKQKKHAILFGFQFGKRFDRLAFRLGLFENTFGTGVDYYVPLNTNKVHWITTFEAFDFKGVNRLDDTRPHFKWLNKLYFMKHIYTTFGFDDVYSKRNANPFFGGGIRFGDKDLKYLLPSLPVSSLKGS